MQQHGSKYFAPSPLPDPWDGVNRSKCIIQIMVIWHIKLKGITKCSSMVANILPATPSWPCSWGQNVKIQLSEHSHVAHQIKGNRITRCSSMVANILPADPSLTLGMESIGQNSTFSEHVMLHINLKGITKCSNMVVTWLKLYRLIYFYWTIHWKVVDRLLTWSVFFPRWT